MSSVVIVDRSQSKIINQPFDIVKRIIDLTICVASFPVMLPLMVLTAIFIRRDSPGPILFKQERIGKGGKPFMIYKFRTMHHNSDKSSHKEFMKQYIQGQITAEDGEDKESVYKPPIQNQVTKVGRILRKTSIDELPQLINVFWGEMSLVGPRPNVPWEVEAYDGWHNERLEVKPGITGLAQVKGRSGISFNQLVKYDVEYVKKRSIILDLKIVWWTTMTVLKGSGAG